METTFFLYVLVGFAAQTIDGALGMAYGVSCNAFLLSLGVPSITPAVASASVHASEIFTTAVSGLSHLRLGNVDRVLFKKLLIPGVVGGILGAYILTAVPGGTIRPIVALYLLGTGLWILVKALRASHQPKEVTSHLVPLGAVGGFFDAIGGGGWGPIVTSTLVARGREPRFAIGSVNLAEFFVTLCESLVFVVAIGRDLAQHWQVIAGLIIGGIIAAPLAAFVCRRIPTRTLMAIVGLVVVVLSIRTLVLTLA